MTKKILKSLGLICCAVAIAITSIFVSVQSNSHHTTSASANDSVSTSYTFTGSNLFYLTLTRFNYNNLESSDLVNFSVSISSYTDGSYSIIPKFSYLSISGLDVSSSYGYMFSTNLDYIGLANNTRIDFPSGQNPTIYILKNHTSPSTREYTPFYVRVNNVNSTFTANIYKVTLSYSSSVASNNTREVYLDYYDIDDNYIRFIFYQYASAPTMESRTYFFNNLQLTDSQLYNSGYKEGLMANQSNIYNDGYDTGYDDGFDNGRIVGGAEANDYSFFSLFGAIFDAPVTLFTSLLNFEFLGINLWSFITSLLTLAIILFIVKLFIRR